MTAIRLRINGAEIADDLPSRLSLADFLRERRNLTGTHLGCEHGICGACTVLVDSEPARRSRIRSRAVISIAGVQNPHCSA